MSHVTRAQGAQKIASHGQTDRFSHVTCTDAGLLACNCTILILSLNQISNDHWKNVAIDIIDSRDGHKLF